MHGKQRLMRGEILTIAAILLASGRAEAADEQPICAARPGKATPPCTVPVGRFQLETGLADWSLQEGNGDRATLTVIGETAVKFGLTDRSDIEVDVVPWQRAASRSGGGHDRASGFGDIVVGYKQALTSPDAPLQASLLPVLKIPTARRSLGNGKVEGGVLVPIQYAIAKTPLSLGLTPEIDWTANGSGSGHHAAMVQVVSLGAQLSQKFSISAELWGQWDWDRLGTRRQYSVDAALAYLAGKDLQLDAGANFGLNRNTPDLELYTGVSARF